MIGPWTKRLRQLERVLGWPRLMAAQQLGVSERVLNRVIEGARPSVELLLRLQAIEGVYAAEIKRSIPYPGFSKAVLFPPVWVECRKRWWIGGIQRKPASRPADLAALGSARPDDSALLSGRYDAGNFPGRTLKLVDWTTEGRARYAADRKPRAGRREIIVARSAKVARTNNQGEAEK